MNGYLLDTNVISEVVRSAPHPHVVAFLSERDSLWLSVIVVHELEYGVQRLPEGQRRAGLRADLSEFITEYSDCIIPLDRAAAEWAARFRAHAWRSGRVLDVGDALIAGTAKANDLTIATRNVRDFDDLDVEAANPWDAP